MKLQYLSDMKKSESKESEGTIPGHKRAADFHRKAEVYYANKTYDAIKNKDRGTLAELYKKMAHHGTLSDRHVDAVKSKGGRVYSGETPQHWSPAHGNPDGSRTEPKNTNHPHDKYLKD